VESQAYSVALITRGGGAYAYTYSGPPELPRGQLAALSFRGALELGVVLEPDPAPPAGARLLPLLPVELSGVAGWGALLLDLAELACATPREVAGHLLFASPATGLRMSLAIVEPVGLPQALRDGLGALCGTLSPARRKQLMQLGIWAQLVEHAASGALRIELHYSGQPGQTRANPAWRRWYTVDPPTAELLGIDQQRAAALPGSYLAGLLAGEQYKAWPVAAAVADWQLDTPPASSLVWESVEWPAGWAALDQLPQLRSGKLRRCFGNWAALRSSTGLSAELGAAVCAGESLLLIAPQAWMLERLWPALKACAPHVLRFTPEGGPSAAAHLVAALAQRGQVVAGGPAAWKLAAYGHFDRIVLLDPSHPQYEPEGEPWLDPRLALLAVLARCPAQLELVELGLSAWDGRCQLPRVDLLKPHEPEQIGARTGGRQDLDPLPLALRQPGTRRLVYFNRLGSSRGLRCIECGSAVGCPSCGSPRIHFSEDFSGYHCPACGFSTLDLRCASCGLATLSAQLPGLEAVSRRPGDVILAGGWPDRLVLPEGCSVFGTIKLILSEPRTVFWPQQIVYVHADDRRGALDDWPRVIDEAARLASLYANPELQQVYIISARLAAQLGGSLAAEELAAAWQREDMLKRLAALPPWGRITYLRLRGPSVHALADARRLVAQRLGGPADAPALRLGRTYKLQHGLGLSGYAVNTQLSHRELQELRAEVARLRVSLSLKPQLGPWL